MGRVLVLLADAAALVRTLLEIRALAGRHSERGRPNDGQGGVPPGAPARPALASMVEPQGQEAPGSARS